MLYALAVALVVLWLCCGCAVVVLWLPGLVPFPTTGGFIHALLMMGVVEQLPRVSSGR